MKKNCFYPVLGKQKSLPVYLSGIGVADPEYHIKREKGLISHQFLYTQSGSGQLLVNGKRYLPKEGSLFYLAPGIAHEYYPVREDEWMTCWVVFRGNHLNEMMKEMGFADFAFANNIVNEEIKKTFQRLYSAAKDPWDGDDRCSILLYEYIMHIRNAFRTNEKYGKMTTKGILFKPLQYIEKHYTDEITLEQLADISNVSKQHFCRVFKAQMKMRPMEYISRKRVTQAKELLLSTSKSIEEIAKLAGYDNPTYFGMVFKKYEGMTPTDCRKRECDL